MNSNLKVVLDTNILLVSISGKSKYHWVFRKLLQQKYQIVITNEILMEYEEIISKKYSSDVAKNVIRTLLLLPNVTKNDIYYNWMLIVADVDDNKFVDCAISANVDYIVTNDKHFDILKTVAFPVVRVINIEQFRSLLK